MECKRYKSKLYPANIDLRDLKMFLGRWQDLEDIRIINKILKGEDID